MGEKDNMDQKEIMRLLEHMLEGANQLVENARKENAEANNPESDNYIIRDCKYATLQYFSGYKQGINLVLSNIRSYYYEEAAEAKRKMNSLYGANVYRDTDSVRHVEVDHASEV